MPFLHHCQNDKTRAMENRLVVAWGQGQVSHAGPPLCGICTFIVVLATQMDVFELPTYTQMNANTMVKTE